MSIAFNSKNHFANALRSVRKSKGLSQEDFSLTSSRTYISSLERDLKSPTLSKIDDLAQVLGVHPLTLLTLAYAGKADEDAIDVLLGLITNEISQLD